MVRLMRLIDADALMEHVGRDRLDSRELIMQMVKNAPTINPKDIVEEQYRKALSKEKKRFRPTECDSDWWYNRKAGIIDGLEIAYESYTEITIQHRKGEQE